MSKTNNLSNQTKYDYANMKTAEYELFDGDAFITFNIVDLDLNSEKITVAITNRGKITVDTYDLKKTLGHNEYYFEYGLNFFEIVFLSDFTQYGEGY